MCRKKPSHIHNARAQSRRIASTYNVPHLSLQRVFPGFFFSQKRLDKKLQCVSNCCVVGTKEVVFQNGMQNCIVGRNEICTLIRIACIESVSFFMGNRFFMIDFPKSTKNLYRECELILIWCLLNWLTWKLSIEKVALSKFTTRLVYIGPGFGSGPVLRAIRVRPAIQLWCIGRGVQPELFIVKHIRQTTPPVPENHPAHPGAQIGPDKIHKVYSVRVCIARVRPRKWTTYADWNVFAVSHLDHYSSRRSGKARKMNKVYAHDEMYI